MTYQLTDLFKDLVRARARGEDAPLPALPKQPDLPPKIQEMTEHINNNFGCQADAVRQLVRMMGYAVGGPVDSGWNELEIGRWNQHQFRVFDAKNNFNSNNYLGLVIMLANDRAIGLVGWLTEPENMRKVSVGNHLDIGSFFEDYKPHVTLDVLGSVAIRDEAIIEDVLKRYEIVQEWGCKREEHELVERGLLEPVKVTAPND